MYNSISRDVVRFVSVLRMPELNPPRLSSLPVHAKTHTTRLVYTPSSLGSVRIGGKVTTLTPPTLTGAIPASDPGNAQVEPQSSLVMPRRSPGEWRWRLGRVPVYFCTVAIPGLCGHSPRLHQGVAVALPGSVWALVELRCRPGCSRYRPCCFRYRPSCSWCLAGCCRSFPMTHGTSRRY
ncbi:hypothetical protein DPMN_101029 [Dreissena polymorpha]|uniref:Uncharacterized protein n=1 Tax=Dreissena polymorpha TaxID=45954 RepID=A0A9D4R9P5_DREPO|nr:hypothetical protein DPMN_101029 [Dreissena polymorpha]